MSTRTTSVVGIGLFAGLLLTTTLTAQIGGALSFDGVDDVVSVPHDSSFPTEVFTAMAWIRISPPLGGNAAVIGRGEDDNSYNFAWQLYVRGNGTLQVTLENVNEENFMYPYTGLSVTPNCTVGSMAVADGTWHHIAATRTGTGDLSIYIDAVEQAFCTGTGVPSSANTQDLTIGATHFFIGVPPGGVEPLTWFFEGEIDEPAMWSVPLTPIEINDVFLNGVNPTDTGLVGYWALNEGSGQSVGDQSVAGNDGYLGEFPTSEPRDPTWLGGGGVTFRRADANGDANVDISDPIYALSALFVPLAPQPPCADAADSNDDGQVDIGDVVFTLDFLFDPTAAPPPIPGPVTCGEDPTADGIACASPCP